MDKKVLILGGNGYVGKAFTYFFEKKNISFTNISRKDADYYQPEVLTGMVAQIAPDVLINCAGYTGKPNVDACEAHKAECLLGNAVLPGVIREVCAAHKLPWIHVSSGCIYTGNSSDGTGFREVDEPNFSFRASPCSFYSGTKALGEEVLAGDSNCYCLRLRIPFNQVDGARNYLSKVMRYENLLDATNSLSQLDDFVSAAWRLFEIDAPKGIYNVTNPGFVTTRRVAEIIRRAGLTQKEFKFFASEEEFMRKAAITPRSNCVLNTDKLLATGVLMRPVEEALEWSVRNWGKE